MTESSHCQACGEEVPEGAPEGMCPRCLLSLAEGVVELAPTLQGVAPPAPLGQTTALAAGSQVGDYELQREIGRGGMGVVYEARHTGLKRKVALKVLPWAEFASEEQRERFRREAEAAARLNHSCIVSVYEWGSHGGCPFMAMQLVDDARSLADVIAKGPLPARDAARIIAKVARAVHYSHQRGVLHRDIKPGNILLDAKGEPLLVDFGLARLEDAAFSLTQADLVFGTPSYMAPEQAAGDQITTASDVYGLGAVLYEAVTGKPPFRGKTVADTMRQVMEQEPVSPRTHRAELDRDIATVILKCLEKKAHRRYGSAEALAEDLERWLENWPIRARPVTITTRAVKWARRRPGVAGLTLALVLTSVIGLGGIVWSWREAIDARADQTEQLWQSLLSEARARRWSHQPGQRYAAIDALQRAASIRASSELQNEAVAALALSDLRPAEAWAGNPDKQPMVAFSRDFKLTAYTKADGTIVVSEREGMKPLAELPGKGTPVDWILRFSPDAQWLAAGTADAGSERVTLTVWDWRKRKAVLSVEAVARASCDFLPGGAGVVACVDRSLKFYRLPNGEEMRPAVPLQGDAHTVRVSASGRFVAASLGNSPRGEGQIAVVNLQEENSAPFFLENKSFVRMLSWHPHRDWIAAPSHDGVVRVWSATERVIMQSFTGHVSTVVEAVWSPEGNLLASNSWDGTLKLWDAATSEMFVSLDQPTGTLQFSADGTRLGAGQDGATVRLYEPARLDACQRMRNPPDGTVWSAAMSFDGSLVATASHKVRLWNTAGYELGHIKFNKPRGVIFGRDSLIVSGGEGVRRWPAHLETVQGVRRAVFEPGEVISGEANWEFAALSGDGRLLAVASASKVGLFDLDNRSKEPRMLQGHPGAANIAVNSVGSLVATGTWRGNEVCVWSVPLGNIVRRLPVRGSAFVAFTVDGKHLITGSVEEYCLWDTETWKVVVSQPRRDDVGGAIAISPRGWVAAILPTRHRVQFAETTKLGNVIEPECGPHLPLCFSHDGAYFLSANVRGHLFLWDLAWIRHEVDRLGLDWHFPPLESNQGPLVEQVVLPSP